MKALWHKGKRKGITDQKSRGSMKFLRLGNREGSGNGQGLIIQTHGGKPQLGTGEGVAALPTTQIQRPIGGREISILHKLPYRSHYERGRLGRRPAMYAGFIGALKIASLPCIKTHGRTSLTRPPVKVKRWSPLILNGDAAAKEQGEPAPQPASSVDFIVGWPLTSQPCWEILVVMIILMTILSGILTVTETKTIPVLLPNGALIHTEVARTHTERATGLMNRKILPPDYGMLFVFDEPDLYFFWMKNTLISLDIIWMDAEMRIIHIEERVPPCRKNPCPSYGRRITSLYVLEVPAGVSQKQNLSVGMRLQFNLGELTP
jgi:uncharacterized protein